MPRKPTTTVPIAVRFWGKVDRSGDCWLWRGCRHPDGYGCAYATGRGNIRAHRLAWELTHGPIPEGLWVLHRCDNRACVNPAHLQLGTLEENEAQKRERSRWRARGRAMPPESYAPPHKPIQLPREASFWSKVDRSGDCWLWMGAVGKEWGAGMFRSRLAHRVAFELTNGPIPPGMLVCHRCDNPRCVRPDHLFLGTSTDNERDKIAKGRRHSQAGASNNQAKLTAEEVTAIRAALAAGESRHALALRYGVGYWTISAIERFKSWRSLDHERAAQFPPMARERKPRA